MSDVYQRVTDQIVATIEAGAGKYKMPWHVEVGSDSSLPWNVTSKAPYRGVNSVVLWCEAQARGYPAHAWATYKQWSALGAQVRKGEKASFIVKVVPIIGRGAESNDDDGESHTKVRTIIRGYFVFNVAQVDGYELPAAEVIPARERIAHAEAWFGALGADIKHGGNRACYSPSQDRICMPVYEAFAEPEAYYSVLAHEATHWTSHAKRCDRQLGKRFGDEAYAAEELIAELGAAFVCATLGLENEPRADHAAYVQSWLKVLRSDSKAIFTAASAAQKAVDYLHWAAAQIGNEKEAAAMSAALRTWLQESQERNSQKAA